MNRLLVRGARQLVTLRGPSSPRRGNQLQDLAVIEDGAVLAVDGVVSEAGPTRRIENLASAKSARIVDATNKIVLPGFVDASTNLLSAARTGHRALTRIRTQIEIQRYLRWFLRQGTTTAGVRFNARKDARLLEALDNRPLGLVPIASIEDADELEAAPANTRVEVNCSTDGLGVSQQLVYAAARRHGYGVRVYGPGAVDVALRGDASVAENPSFDRLESLSEIASSATMTLLTPINVQRQIPRQLIDAGGAIALASGFGPLMPRTTSMPFLLSWAVLEMMLTPEEAISSVTINGAHALGLGRNFGSLEAGKKADLVIFNCVDYQEIPTQPGVDLISMVVKNGEIVYREFDWDKR